MVKKILKIERYQILKKLSINVVKFIEFNKNKAVYLVMQKLPENAEKTNALLTDQPTDQPTTQWGIESRARD